MLTAHGGAGKKLLRGTHGSQAFAASKANREPETQCVVLCALGGLCGGFVVAVPRTVHNFSRVFDVKLPRSNERPLKET